MSTKNVHVDAGQINDTELVPLPRDVLSAQLGEETVKRTQKLEDKSIDLALRVKEARDFLTWSTHHMRRDWHEWMEEANEATSQLNMIRMAFDRESKTVIAAGKDVREFFNSQEYRDAHDKFNQMIALLNDFERLKKNGTLDAFADFILKVSCK